MTVDATAIRAAERGERRAVYAGTAATAVAALTLFVLPDLLPVDAIGQWYFDLTGRVMRGDPFTPLRLCGGLVGGAVAGWLTPGLGSGMVTGLKAALYGLVVAYGLAVAYFLLYSVLAGAFPPPLLAITSVPLIYAIPLFGTHLIEGAVVGFLADMLH